MSVPYCLLRVQSFCAIETMAVCNAHALASIYNNSLHVRVMLLHETV